MTSRASRLDLAHPLAAGLLGCWVADEPWNQPWTDRCAWANMIPQANCWWDPARGGLVTVAPSGAVAYDSDGTPRTPARLRLSGPCTVVWRGTLLSAAGSSGLITCRPHASIAAPTFCYEIALDGTPSQLKCFTNDGTNAQSMAASSGTALDTPAAGVEFQAAMTIGAWTEPYGNLWILYNGGTVIGAQWIPQWAVWYGADSVLGFGEPVAGAAGTATIAHRMGLIYGRVLQPPELAWLADEPYAFVEPAMSTRYFLPTAWRPVARRTISGRVGSRGAS